MAQIQRDQMLSEHRSFLSKDRVERVRGAVFMSLSSSLLSPAWALRFPYWGGTQQVPGKGSDICGIPAFASEVSLLHNGHGGIMKSHPELLDWPQHQQRFWGLGDASEKELGAVPRRCHAPSPGTTKHICSPKWLIS